MQYRKEIPTEARNEINTYQPRKNKRRRTLGYDNRKQEWELLPEVERNGSRKRRPSWQAKGPQVSSFNQTNRVGRDLDLEVSSPSPLLPVSETKQESLLFLKQERGRVKRDPGTLLYRHALLREVKRISRLSLISTFYDFFLSSTTDFSWIKKKYFNYFKLL